jgi:hypothetical protein
MSSGTMTVAAILGNLEEQIAFHRDREAFHGQEKARHEEEQARHAAELARVTGHYETFKAAADGVQPVIRVAKVVQGADEDLGERPKVSRALARVVRDWQAGVPFGPSAVAAEVNRRFAGKLRRPIDVRAASTFLRRRLRDGSLAGVRPGRPVHEALYRKP